ncbi:hypothetical protein SprV_0401692600 [Sparganum proliferum]
MFDTTYTTIRTFVCQRSRDLEAFLNRLLAHYTLPPAPLAAFIDWDRYDIHGITNFLARQLLKEGDTILSRNLLYSMKVYQLSAVNRRIISPVAPILFNEPKEDFGHVLDFLGSLEKLRASLHAAFCPAGGYCTSPRLLALATLSCCPSFRLMLPVDSLPGPREAGQ